jgi:DNA-binding transcriptional MerR regulator
MNEGNGSILSKETRKRKRGSGFRYSSKKDLERSKLKRAAKSRGSKLASVTKALSFPFAQSSSGINGSGGPISLNIVNEQDGDEKDLSQGNAIIEGEYILQVSTF